MVTTTGSIGSMTATPTLIAIATATMASANPATRPAIGGTGGRSATTITPRGRRLIRFRTRCVQHLSERGVRQCPQPLLRAVLFASDEQSLLSGAHPANASLADDFHQRSDHVHRNG